MTDVTSPTQIEAEILALPPAASRAFVQARDVLAHTLGPEDLHGWSLEGREIARQSFRAWEAAAEYFRVSAILLPARLPLSYLASWVGKGNELATSSSALSVAYFRASPEILGRLAPRHLASWAAQGQRLYRGTWKSSTLSAHFFEASPNLLDHMDLEELDLFSAFLEILSKKSYELTEECLTIAEFIFSHLAQRDVKTLLSLLLRTADGDWKYAKECFQAGAAALARVEPTSRPRFLRYAEEMIGLAGKRHIILLTDGSRALSQLAPTLHKPTLDMFEELRGTSLPTAVEFLKSVPAVLARVQGPALTHWYLEGARTLAANEAAGISYFKLESGRGEALLASLSARVELDSILPILRMYSRALTGEELDIQAPHDRGAGWTSMEQAATDGRTIFLPPTVNRFESQGENFSWYKVITTHQIGHMEFFTFEFSFERSGALFPTWRDQVEAEAGTGGQTTLADFQRFFDLFPDRRLVADIFSIVEDARVDYLVTHNYAGLRRSYDGIRSGAVEGRPHPDTLPLREALLEILVRMTLLESPATVPIPEEFRPVVERIAVVLLHLRDVAATVEDAAEAALRIYRLVAQVPNVTQTESEWQDVDVGELGQDAPTTDVTSLSPQEAETAESAGDTIQLVPNSGENPQESYQSPEQVDYRGEFKPELVQVVANLRETDRDDDPTGATPIDEEALRRLAEQSAEIELSDVIEGEIDESAGLFVSQLMQELLDEADKSPEGDQRRSPSRRKADQDGPLDEDPPSFLYDEWDFKANDYKPRWCRVREVAANEGTTEFYDRTLEHHATLLSQVRRQFELLAPEMYRKVKRLEDGEEFDLDAVIESVIERRSGVPPNEKVYWRRNKVQRDVAVIFLLDMSASTAEAIDEKARGDTEWRDIPDDPREYLFWLRSRREAAKRNYKRIIDIERESTVLLINALETIGDRYGIHGFSGYGRENVEFYTIKDLGETFSDAVPRRIDGIAPLHATRMGPAIRHAITKLEAQLAKTKILFLISDGRPQDRGYSREGVDKEYAVQDTHKALLEARAVGITPFCLTVDRSGHDYMKEMCGDIAYEVLEDVTSLPERLPLLYRRLTV